MKKIITFLILLTSNCLLSQKTYTHIALLNGVAHIGNGTIIENSLIVINKDKIETVSETRGLKLDYKSFDTVINIQGKHVYPALINPNNVLGLHDAEAVRATVDFAEVGTLNPHVRTLIAYNTDNIIVPTIKTNGVLYTQATPRGGIISGSSSIMKLEAWNWEDAVLKADDGIHLNFPKYSIVKWSEEDGLSKSNNKKYDEELNTLTTFFENAWAYANQTSVTEKNIRFEAMKKIVSGESNLYIHADKVKDILAALQFSKKFGIKKMVIVGGKESYQITQELKRNSIPVMLNRLHDLPDNADDEVDLIYRLPYLLKKDSVLFCLQLEGDMEAMNSRNLPFIAGTAATYGLTKEDALRSVTLDAAKILGVDKQLGSLEEGKLASLVISEGDLLDMKTNQIILAYLEGKPINLSNKQTELYNKYKTKFGIK
jgi:imidazolonepropionase-like amidohydrolase